MTTRTYYAFVLIFHAAAIVLLLYVAFVDRNAPVHISISPNLIESTAVMPSGNQYGLSDEDAERLKGLLEKEQVIAAYRISKPTVLKTQNFEVGGIVNELLPELERYQTMSEQEKKQLEAELAKRILGSKELRELLDRISKALHDIEPSSEGSEVEQ